MKAQLALLVAILFVAGCATTQEDQAKTEGTAVGAALGALVGAGIGYAAGGTKGAVIGGVTGATLGGTGGYVYANQVANRHKALAGKENDLDARVAFAR